MRCFSWINVKTWGIRWLGINFRQPEQKEGLILYSSELWMEALYFCIEGFRCSICGTLFKEVNDSQIVCLYGSCHSWESKESRSVHFVIPSGKSCQSGILMLALVIYQSESHWKIVCFLWYRDILWRGFRHAVIRSIRTLSYRGDSYQRNILCSINRLNNLHLFVVGMVSTESTFCYTCHSNSLNSSLFNNNCIRYYKAIIKSQDIKDAFVWMLTTIE